MNTLFWHFCTNRRVRYSPHFQKWLGDRKQKYLATKNGSAMLYEYERIIGLRLDLLSGSMVKSRQNPKTKYCQILFSQIIENDSNHVLKISIKNYSNFWNTDQKLIYSYFFHSFVMWGNSGIWLKRDWLDEKGLVRPGWVNMVLFDFLTVISSFSLFEKKKKL